MKNALSVFVLLLLCGGASAQIVWEDAVADTARGFETEDDIETHNKVTFTTPGTYRWVRTFSSPCGVKSAICDKNTCYLETTDSANFDVVANESFDMIAHFYPYGNCCPEGVDLTLYVFKVDEPSVNSTMSFHLDLWCASANVSELESNPFTLSPNPATTEISISGDLSEVYDVTVTDLTGKTVEVREVAPGKMIVASLPKGTYLVTVLTENAVYTQRFLKL